MKITPEDIGEFLAAAWFIAVILVIALAPFVALGMIITCLWGIL